MLDKFAEESNTTIEPGSRIQLQKRIQRRNNKLTPKVRKRRENLNEALQNGLVNPANENISVGTLAGGVGTFIVWLVEDYLPGQIGAQADIVSAEPADGGIKYVVDSNAPLESQARFRAFLDAGTGVTSLWTDEFDVQSVEVIKTRAGRDTHRYEIVVKD